MRKKRSEKDEYYELLHAILEELREIKKELRRLNAPIRIRPDTWLDPEPFHPIKPRWGMHYFGSNRD